MAIASVRLPNQRTLTAALAPLIEGTGHRRNGNRPGLLVLKRRRHIEESSFASEIVRCQLSDGSKLELVCKYTAKLEGPPGAESWGHRAGVLHEARVYRDVLQPTGLPHPRYFGLCRDRTTGERWLVLEYLRGGLRVGLSKDPAAMGLAARWIGRFHALTTGRARSQAFPFLRTFDAGYYHGWVRRTLKFASHLHKQFPWLTTLDERFADWAPLLLAHPSVIHGEYYGRNVLFREGTVYPIDWESAAVGAGEIDLAALIENWAPETATQCVREYQHARWPRAAPAEFSRRLDAARMFNAFRWLGDEPELTRQRGMRFYFDELRMAATRLGLLS